MTIDITDGSAIMDALQRHIDTVVTEANLETARGHQYRDITNLLYWHNSRPPLASVSMGYSNQRVGIRLEVMTKNCRNVSDPLFPRRLWDALEIQLADSNAGVRFEPSLSGLTAHLIVSPDILRAAKFAVRITQQG